MIIDGKSVGWEKFFRLWADAMTETYDFLPSKAHIELIRTPPLYTHSYLYVENRKIMGGVGIYADDLSFGLYEDLAEYHVSGPFVLGILSVMVTECLPPDREIMCFAIYRETTTLLSQY